MRNNFMFTSESVTPGHPDKLCDQISDAVVDRLLQQDPLARVMAECAVSTGVLFLSVRFEPNAAVDFTQVARQVIDRVGYHQPPFSSKHCTILTNLEELSGQRRDRTEQLTDAQIERIAAKDQATVFGFACNQTPQLMPLPVVMAHALARALTAARQQTLPYLNPDGKTQVGIEYRHRQPHRIHSVTVVASQAESAEISLEQLRQDIRTEVIVPAFAEQPLQPDPQTLIFVNPDGPVINGGPAVHDGLTGRKNGIDTYGDYAKHSSAALSGKDPLRIDRVGAYAARYAAKNVVAAGLAAACEVQLSYTIGLSHPVSVQVEAFDTEQIPEEAIAQRLVQHFDFRPAGIIRDFGLETLPAKFTDGFYQKLAVYGHMGRTDLAPPWEQTDKVSLLRGEIC
ncbi:MAG: methionine adenosyltransferase [Cyanobacteria bacterium J06648_16]